MSYVVKWSGPYTAPFYLITVFCANLTFTLSHSYPMDASESSLGVNLAQRYLACTTGADGIKSNLISR